MHLAKNEFHWGPQVYVLWVCWSGPTSSWGTGWQSNKVSTKKSSHKSSMWLAVQVASSRVQNAVQVWKTVNTAAIVFVSRLHVIRRTSALALVSFRLSTSYARYGITVVDPLYDVARFTSEWDTLVGSSSPYGYILILNALKHAGCVRDDTVTDSLTMDFQRLQFRIRYMSWMRRALNLVADQ